MAWIQQLWTYTNDPVRSVQFFMLCRQTGIILSSIVIARALSVEEVGVFEMLMLCGYLLTFFWSDALLKSFLARPVEGISRESGSAFLWFYLFAAGLAMAVLVLGQKVLLPLMVDRHTLTGLGLFAIYQMLIVPLWVAPFLGLLKGQRVFLLAIYVLVGPSLAAWAGLSGIADVTGVLIGFIAYALTGFLWVLTNTSFVREFNVLRMFRILWPATWPLAMYAVSTGLARSFDVWLVAHYFDEATFAIFRYGAREFPIVLAFAAGLSTVMIPLLKSKEGLMDLQLRSTRLMHICYPIVSVFMVISPVLFVFFFGEDYRGSAIIFNVYLLLAGTQLIFPQSILIARGDTKLLWYISIAELMVNIVASLILLSWIGLIGIAFGTLIAFVFEKLVLMYFVWRRYGIKPGSLTNLSVWALYALIIVICFTSARWIFGI